MAFCSRRNLLRRVSLRHLHLFLAPLLTCVVCVLMFVHTFSPPAGSSAHRWASLAIKRRGHGDESYIATESEFTVNVRNRSMIAPVQMTFSESGSDVRRNVSRILYIHSSLKSIVTWNELENLVACVKKERSNSTPCEVTCPSGDRIRIRLDDNISHATTADAVLIGLSPFSMKYSFPKLLQFNPMPGQLVVFYSMENVMRVHKWNPRAGLLKYHVDMTYGAYSNVTIPYAYFRQRPESPPESPPENTRNWAEGKTRLIAWMASNCKEVFWPRNEFVAELQRHLDIDTYGKCGNMTCLPRLSERCQTMLTKYKFYLSLENSECADYLTEKLWNSGLNNGVIPVVYGPRKSDFEKLAPPNSFIHVSDFDTPKALADYIKRVDNDTDLYNSYFKWRETGHVVQVYPKLKMTYFCGLLPHMEHVPETMREVKDSGWYNSCRHQIQVNKAQQLPALQALKGWKPW